MGTGNPITTFSVTNLQRVAAATEVKVLPRPISSATSAPGISPSQTHLLKMNQMAQTSSARNLVKGRPGIVFLQPGTRSSVDWRIGCRFSSTTASIIQTCSNSLLILLRTVFSTKLVFSGSRTYSPSFTSSWTSVAILPVFVLFWLISFSYSDICWADKLILRNFWKYISMLGISQWSNHLNEYTKMEYKQFCSFYQNLHSYKYHSLAHHPPLPPLLPFLHPLQNLP